MRFVFGLKCQFKFHPPKQTNTPPQKKNNNIRFLMELKISQCIDNLLTCAQDQNRHTFIEQNNCNCYLTLCLNDIYMVFFFQFFKTTDKK